MLNLQKEITGQFRLVQSWFETHTYAFSGFLDSLNAIFPTDKKINDPYLGKRVNFGRIREFLLSYNSFKSFRTNFEQSPETFYVHFQVLLLEAGIEEPEVANIPAFETLLYGSNIDWTYHTQPELYACRARKNKECATPRGKVCIHIFRYHRVSVIIYMRVILLLSRTKRKVKIPVWLSVISMVHRCMYCSTI